MSFALERLRRLRAERRSPDAKGRRVPVPYVDGPAEITPADLPGDWRVEWEERAAIREHEGGQAREHAEAEALSEILTRMGAAGEFP